MPFSLVFSRTLGVQATAKSFKRTLLCGAFDSVRFEVFLSSSHSTRTCDDAVPEIVTLNLKFPARVKYM